MTLTFVEIHCGLIDSPGMLGVAIGRVRSSAGLRLVNFTPLAVVPPRTDDVAFSCTPSHNITSGCCTSLPLPIDLVQHERTQECVVDNEDWDVEPDQEMLDAIDKFVISVAHEHSVVEDKMENPSAEEKVCDKPAVPSIPHLPKDFDVNMSLELLKFQKEVTKYHVDYNALIEKIKDSDAFANSLGVIYSQVKEQHTKLIPEIPPKNPSQETSFQKWLAQFCFCDIYQDICRQVFGPTPTDKELDIIWRMVYGLHSAVAVEREVTRKLPETSLNPRFNPDRFSSSGVRGKLRYIVGYVVFALRKGLTKKLRVKQQYTSLAELEQWDKTHNKLILARLMWRSPDQVLAETQDVESLEEIQRRQYIGQGLTNVSDSTFYYFKDLCLACLKLMDSSTIASHPEDSHKFIYNSLITNAVLERKWNNIFSNQQIVPEVSSDCISTLCQETMHIFTRTMMRQWRRDIIGSISKKIAHRKEVTKASSSLKRKSSVAVTSTCNTNTEDVHGKLCHMGTSQLAKFLKKDILTMCHAYSVKKPQTTTKKILLVDLEQALKENQDTPDKDKLNALSISARHILGESLPAETNLDSCKECNKTQDEDDKWIQCDKCDR